jgi:fatty-acyl-CoA synthase
MDVSQLIQRAVRQYPDRVAVVARSGQRTYAELGERACRLASALAGQGVAAGDRVVVLLENRIEYPEVDVALAYGGFVRVALNIRLGLSEFSASVEDSDARVLITQAKFADVAAQLVEQYGLLWISMEGGEDPRAVGYESLLETGRPVLPDPVDRTDEPAWFSYTSGTTGRPKGVVLSHRALAHVAWNLMIEIGPHSPEEAVLLPQPLSHGAGYFTLAYLGSGAAIHVVPDFDPEEIVSWGEKWKIDTLKLVPTMLDKLLELDRPAPFKRIVYGASPIARPILDRAMGTLDADLVQIYGQSEAPVTITCLGALDHRDQGPHLGSAGRPWRSVDVLVADPDGRPLPAGELGEVIVRGDHLMTGYHHRPEQTAEVLRNGWLWTRDMAVIDDRGYIYLRGRRDDMINSGGFNIAPREIEDVVNDHPLVQECAAVGLPDERWGERVCVYVVTTAGRQLSYEELDRFCEPRLGFRRPRSLVLLNALPYTAYGKVDRKQLVAAPAEETR